MSHERSRETCSECSHETTHYSMKFRGARKIVTCHVCSNPRHSLTSGHGATMYDDLVLDHVSDELGNKVRVTSRRQLHEAEKRYNFKHHAANMDQKNWDKPPQPVSGNIQDNVKWLYPEIAKQQIKDMKEGRLK